MTVKVSDVVLTNAHFFFTVPHSEQLEGWGGYPSHKMQTADVTSPSNHRLSEEEDYTIHPSKLRHLSKIGKLGFGWELGTWSEFATVDHGIAISISKYS